MNDLERDLTELFETKAGGLDTTPLAPPAVLRRGRRRQVGTVVGGALMTVAAAAVVIGGAAAFLGDRASEPPILGEREVLPARTATIGGVTVTAPEGWSLLDQSTLGLSIPTETCMSSFEGTATPVGPGASEGDPDVAPVETPPTVEEECTPEDLPGGAPLFTLANVEPNPLQTVCEVTSELPVQGVGPTDAYLYVALDPNPSDPGASWPAELDTVLPGTCGTAEQAWWTVNGVGYMAAVAIGEDASQADRDAVLTAFEDLAFAGSPQPATHPVIGYVVAAGIEDGIPWRLVAGPNLACSRESECSVALQLTTTRPDGTEETAGVLPPIPGTGLLQRSQAVGGSTIAFGTAEAQVEAIEIVTTEGQKVTPDAVAWPDPLQAFAYPTAPIDGTIWWAMVPDVASIDAVLEDGSTVSGDSGEVPPLDVSGEEPGIAELRLDTQEIGGETVATMDVFGRTLEIRQELDGVVALSMDGMEPISFQMVNGTGTQHEVPGGAIALYQGEPDEGPSTVVVDGTGETLVGRWFPLEDPMGKAGRLWILPLPGEGSGLSRLGRDDLATATSWPPGREPAAGVVVFAGDNGDGVSWKVGYTSPDCVVVAQVDGDSSIGQTDCLTPMPVSDQLIAAAPGRQRSMIAVVSREAEGIYVGDIASPTIFGQCGDVTVDPSWEGRSVCVIVVPNDQDITMQATLWDSEARVESPVGDPITVRVSDGELFLTDGG